MFRVDFLKGIWLIAKIMYQIYCQKKREQNSISTSDFNKSLLNFESNKEVLILPIYKRKFIWKK